MGKGKGFGKTILIGDQFVLWEIPAILAAIPFKTECTVTRRASGTGWSLDDRRTEVPGYKKEKKTDCMVSFDRMIQVLGLDLEKVAAAFEARGIATIRATIGGIPTDDRAFQILK